MNEEFNNQNHDEENIEVEQDKWTRAPLIPKNHKNNPL